MVLYAPRQPFEARVAHVSVCSLFEVRFGACFEKVRVCVEYRYSNRIVYNIL